MRHCFSRRRPNREHFSAPFFSGATTLRVTLELSGDHRWTLQIRQRGEKVNQTENLLNQPSSRESHGVVGPGKCPSSPLFSLLLSLPPPPSPITPTLLLRTVLI